MIPLAVGAHATLAVAMAMASSRARSTIMVGRAVAGAETSTKQSSAETALSRSSTSANPPSHWLPSASSSDQVRPPGGIRLLRVETEAGVRHRKPHMMRHTFATDVLDATEGNLYAVSSLLGHSSTRVTETYLHSSQTHNEAAIEALGEYRKAPR